LTLVRRFASFAPFNVVLLNYFRFPGEYMRRAYTLVFRELLPTLRARGMLTESTVIVAPHLDSTFLRPLSATRLIAPIAAQHNPLFMATEETEQDDLGDFTNKSQVQQLHSSSPFVRVWLE
jgi:Na+/H+ antiporter NhaB